MVETVTKPIPLKWPLTFIAWYTGTEIKSGGSKIVLCIDPKFS